MRFSWMPSCRAASATESFCSVTILTAESLNSAVYVVRERAIGELLRESLHLNCVSTKLGEPQKTFGQSAREMDYGTSYDQQAGVVLALFRVPKGVAGFTSFTSYSQLYAEKQQFYELGIAPYCRALGVFLTQSLALPWCK